MAKKLVIISIDALGADDLCGDISHLPTLSNLIQSGTHVKKVEPIYPSLTYPSHTTIVTGVYPIKHGIENNTRLQSFRKSPDWYWFHKDIKVPTLYDCAKNEGKTIASFLLPVSGSSCIDYNIAEIFPNRAWETQVGVSLQASSPKFLYDMNKKFGHLRKGIEQPYLDNFVTASVVDTLYHKQPDLTLVHLVDLDTMRHHYGVNSSQAKDALIRQDSRVEKIINATKEVGTFSDTNFVVLGDHYQIDVTKKIRLNTLFHEKNWLSLRRNNLVEKGWNVYAKSCDGSCYIYCDVDSNVSPQGIRELVESVEGVENVYTTEQAERMGASAECTFMLEAKRGYYFVDEAVGRVVSPIDSHYSGQPDYYCAVHGFSPQKEDYQTTILFNGPDVAKGKTIEYGHLIDEAPTFAKLMNLCTFPKKINGTLVNDIFC